MSGSFVQETLLWVQSFNFCSIKTGTCRHQSGFPPAWEGQDERSKLFPSWASGFDRVKKIQQLCSVLGDVGIKMYFQSASWFCVRKVQAHMALLLAPAFNHRPSPITFSHLDQPLRQETCCSQTPLLTVMMVMMFAIRSMNQIKKPSVRLTFSC